MKVTKTGARIEFLKQQKAMANIGCNICPNCGENRHFFPSLPLFTKAGILQSTYTSWAAGFFRTKYMREDNYHCLTCGCEWKSEPYEYA